MILRHRTPTAVFYYAQTNDARRVDKWDLALGEPPEDIILSRFPSESAIRDAENDEWRDKMEPIFGKA